jgi:hypothetical protein
MLVLGRVDRVSRFFNGGSLQVAFRFAGTVLAVPHHVFMDKERPENVECQTCNAHMSTFGNSLLEASVDCGRDFILRALIHVAPLMAVAANRYHRKFGTIGRVAMYTSALQPDAAAHSVSAAYAQDAPPASTECSALSTSK